MEKIKEINTFLFSKTTISSTFLIRLMLIKVNYVVNQALAFLHGGKGHLKSCLTYILFKEENKCSLMIVPDLKFFGGSCFFFHW